MTTMTAADARTQAIALAGSDDFGPSGFEEGLDRTLDAFARMPLTEPARASALRGRTSAMLLKFGYVPPFIQPRTTKFSRPCDGAKC